MQWVEASHQDYKQGRADSLGGSDSAPRKETLTHPPLSVAEREKRWADHLKAIAKVRYQGDGPRPAEP
jgi:hypothetical protein